MRIRIEKVLAIIAAATVALPVSLWAGGCSSPPPAQQRPEGVPDLPPSQRSGTSMDQMKPEEVQRLLNDPKTPDSTRQMLMQMQSRRQSR